MDFSKIFGISEKLFRSSFSKFFGVNAISQEQKGYRASPLNIFRIIKPPAAAIIFSFFEKVKFFFSKKYRLSLTIFWRRQTRKVFRQQTSSTRSRTIMTKMKSVAVMFGS